MNGKRTPCCRPEAEAVQGLRSVKQAGRVRPGGNRGFTLVETLVAVTLTAVLATVVYPALVNVLANWQSGQEKAGRQQELRIAVDLISGEVRQAAKLITTAEGGQANAVLEFEKDGDGGTVTVKFYLDGDQIWRQASGAESGTGVLASEVETAFFEFLTADGLPADPAAAVLVRIRLTSTGGKYRLETMVAPRLL